MRETHGEREPEIRKHYFSGSQTFKIMSRDAFCHLCALSPLPKKLKIVEYFGKKEFTIE